MGRCASTFAAAVAALLLCSPACPAATPTRALTDDLAFLDPRPGPRALAFDTAHQAGAQLVRLTLDWSRVAPGGATKPAGFHASDPADPAYSWGYIEDAVRDANSAGLRVMLMVERAPAWARGPDPRQLGAFVRAAGRRFSGFYPDPKDNGDGLRTPGKSLPHVRLWQIWNAPNDRARLTARAAVRRYREILTAAARAVRRVADDNVVVGAATVEGGAISPVRFWRRLGRAPYDIAADDLRNRPVFSRLAALRHALRGKPLWLTDVGLDTPPRDPHGASTAAQARFVARALYRADRARVGVVAWRGLQDRTSYLTGFPSIASGLFFNIDNDLARDPPKPAYASFRFPFVVSGRTAWGIAPMRHLAVEIEKRSGQGWTPIRTVVSARSGEFTSSVRGRGVYRAVQAGAASPAWRR